MVCLVIVVLKLLASAADKNGQEILEFFLGLLLFPLMMLSWVWLWSCCSLRVPCALTTCWETGNNFLLNFLEALLIPRAGWLFPGTESVIFLLLLLSESGHWFGFSVKTFSKCPISFFSPFFFSCAQTSFVLFHNSGPHKSSISCSLFVNDVVTMIQFLPELLHFMGKCHPAKGELPACHPPCDGTASPPGTAELAGFTAPGTGFQCFWNPVQIFPIQSGDRRILFPL